jgi:hypothetical protein
MGIYMETQFLVLLVSGLLEPEGVNANSVKSGPETCNCQAEEGWLSM